MTFIVYPAIDLRAGRVVRLREGDPGRMTVYGDDPAQTARRWLAAGAPWLHVVDLDGAFGEKDHANRSALASILQVTGELGARLQFGGGIRSLDDIEAVLDLGVSRAILGTLAVEQPAVVSDALQKFGVDRIAVGIDARDGMVRVRGWQEEARLSAVDLALRMRTSGLRTVIFTDVSRDGLGSGLNIASTRELAQVSGLDVIASGGVHTVEDIVAARGADLAGVIVGRALYEGTIDLKQALELEE